MPRAGGGSLITSRTKGPWQLLCTKGEEGMGCNHPCHAGAISHTTHFKFLDPPMLEGAWNSTARDTRVSKIRLISPIIYKPIQWTVKGLHESTVAFAAYY